MGSKKATSFDFDKKLADLNKLGIEIGRYQPSDKNAQEIQAKIKSYGEASSMFEGKELTPPQTAALKKARNTHRATIADIKGQLPALIKAQQKTEQKNREAFAKQQAKQTEALKARDELFKQVEAAASAYSKTTAPTMMEQFATFKKLRAELDKVLQILPASDKRAQDFERLRALSSEITKKHENNLVLRDNMREHVQEIVASKCVKIDEAVKQYGSLWDAAVATAPKPVQQAIGRFRENKKAMAALKNSAPLKKLLGEKVEEGIKQIVFEPKSNAVALNDGGGAVAAIAPQDQVAVLEAVYHELSQIEGLESEDRALVQQFLGTIIALAKGAQQLQDGEKEYVTYAAEVGSKIVLLHVSLHDILKDPSTIGRSLSTFIELGVTQQAVHIQFTSRVEVIALSVIMNHADVGALKGQMEALSHEDLRRLTQGSMEGALVQSVNGALTAATPVKTLPEMVALITQASANVDTLVEFFGAQKPQLKQELTQVLGELQSHYASQPPKARTQENNHFIVKQMLVMAATAQEIGQVISRPAGHPDQGGIGRFVNSSIFPGAPEGNVNLLMDSSLEGRPEVQQLMVGMLPVPQLVDHNDLSPEVPAVLPPQEPVNKPHPAASAQQPKPAADAPSQVAKPPAPNASSTPEYQDVPVPPENTGNQGVQPPKPADKVVVPPPAPVKPGYQIVPEVPADPSPSEIEFFLNSIRRKPQLPEPAKRIDLTIHKKEFEALVHELAQICEELGEKQEDHGKKYDRIMQQALNLYDKLHEQGELFFNSFKLNEEDLTLFKEECTRALEEATVEFEKHRGTWWDHSGMSGKLLAAAKAFLGVLAAIPLGIPALIIENTTKHGFVHTFFTKPSTDSAAGLDKIKAEFAEQGVDLDEAVKDYNKSGPR